MNLARYLSRRVLIGAVQVFALVVGSFFLMRMLPGDPVVIRLGPMATDESIAKLRHDLGLDLPLPVQLGRYIQRVARGDLGHSWRTANPVVEDLEQRFPATLELITLSMGLALAFAIPVGIIAAMRTGGFLDRATLMYALLAGALPDFYIGLLLIFVFYFKLGLAPPPMGRLDLMLSPPIHVTKLYVLDSLLSGNWETLRSALSHLALPVLTLAFVQAGPIMKMTRSTMLQILDGDFINHARLSGLKNKYVWRYALRNTLPSVVTLVGILYGILLGGAVLVETVFAWGGLGQYSVLAIVNSDYDAIQGFVFVAASFSLVIFLLLDVLHVVIDPRVEY